MKSSKAFSFWIVLASLLSGYVHAQSTLPSSEFPATTGPVTAQALREALADRSFEMRLASGDDARYEFKGNYLYVNFSTMGRRMQMSGTWRTEDSNLCIEYPNRQGFSGCNEVRADGATLWLKRIANGEVVQLMPR